MVRLCYKQIKKTAVFAGILLVALFAVVAMPMLGVQSAKAATPWTGILDPTRAIDWSTAGAGTIPARTTICSTLGTAGQASSFIQSVTVAQINSALASCPSGQTVLLNPGTYNTNGGTITIPSNVTLRGSSPTKTVVMETTVPTTGFHPVIQFGTQASYPFGPEPNSGVSTAITGGTAQGSRQITLTSTSGISVGTLLMLTQQDLSYMTENGSNGTCTWCNGGVTGAGDSGQTVQVTAISGNTVTISDPLYIAYTNSPMAYPFRAGAVSAGLENLKISASNAEVANVNGVGYSPNIQMTGTIYSWVKNVESDFSEGDHLQALYSMHNTVRDSFFHDGFNHGPGTTDDDLLLATKASANLIENNIWWRQHIGVSLDWGASGNVISYNYFTGAYNTPAPNAAETWGPDYHGAHPMMNLFEGNISSRWSADETHGSSSHTTIFRDYATGANKYVPPADVRGTLQTGSPTQENGYGSFAYVIQNLNQYNNLVGVIDGSDYLVNTQHAPARLVAPTASGGSNPACISVGYNDGFSTGPSPDLTDSTMVYQGVMDCTNGTFQWQNGVQTLPPSFYLSAKPSWWGNFAWPPIGPDVTGGNFKDWVNPTAAVARGHVNIIPALACFNAATNNGTTNTGNFDANTCYGQSTSDTTPPSVPTNLTATAVSASQINLSWTASTDNVGVAGYRIYRNGVQLATAAPGTSYQDTGLTAGTTYTYAIAAFDAAANTSAQSGSASTTTFPPTSTKFAIGDRVQVTASLNVRATPGTSGTLLGTQASGALGTVAGGPTYANGYWWWNITFNTSPSGWSIEDYLVKSTADTTPPSTPANLTASAIRSLPRKSILHGAHPLTTWASRDTRYFEEEHRSR